MIEGCLMWGGKMKNKRAYSQCEDTREMIETVHSFLKLSEDLLSKKIITKAQYDEITWNKIKFLDRFENKNDEKI